MQGHRRSKVDELRELGESYDTRDSRRFSRDSARRSSRDSAPQAPSPEVSSEDGVDERMGSLGIPRGLIAPQDTSDWHSSELFMLQVIGAGSFAAVRLAQHRPTGTWCAVKIMNKAHVVQRQQTDHVLSERRLLKEFNNPFIMRMYHSYSDNLSLYLVLEYVPGGELFSHLRQARKFPSDVAKFFASEIIEAFSYLHDRRVAYRDLKPENVVLDALGHAKLTDFGFAQTVHDRLYSICGTPEYLAPEVILSKGHTTAVDWWTLGILIYEMLLGYPPFYDERQSLIYEKILVGALTFPRWFDRRAKDLVKALLTSDPTKRIGNLRRGAQDIRRHKWFTGVDWGAVVGRRYRPPIRVELKDFNCVRCDDELPDDPGIPLSLSQEKLFSDF